MVASGSGGLMHIFTLSTNNYTLHKDILVYIEEAGCTIEEILVRDTGITLILSGEAKLNQLRLAGMLKKDYIVCLKGDNIQANKDGWSYNQSYVAYYRIKA